MKKTEFVFVIWILVILFLFVLNINYHFKGSVSKNKFKTKLLQDIDNYYFNQKSKQLYSEDDKKWTILMFAHIYCPCTKASIIEFEKISRKYKFKPLIIFDYIPEEELKENFLINDLQSNIQLTQNFNIDYIIDYKQKIIKKHKITTSGFTVLYDNNFNVIYTGGVTPYRSHIGESDLHRYLTKLEKNNILNINNEIQESEISNNLKQLFKSDKIEKKITTYNSTTFGCEF